MTQESGGILRPLLYTERAINVGCVTMSLLLDSDNLPRRGKLRQHLAKRGADGREIAVQQHQWPTAAVDLVVHLQIVHRNIATLHGRVWTILCCHVYSYSFCYSLMRMCWHHFFLGLGASRNAMMNRETSSVLQSVVARRAVARSASHNAL